MTLASIILFSVVAIARLILPFKKRGLPRLAVHAVNYATGTLVVAAFLGTSGPVSEQARRDQSQGFPVRGHLSFSGRRNALRMQRHW
jgi:hypothetical protein